MAAEKEISKEEGNNRLAPSSAVLKHFVKLKLCGHRHTTVPGDINEQNVMCGGGCGCFEVVVDYCSALLQQLL